MKNNWLMLPAAIIIALLLVFLAAYITSQPDVSENIGAEFVDVNGDEYLEGVDYIPEELEGIGTVDNPNIPSDYFVPKSLDDCEQFDTEQGKDNCYYEYSVLFEETSGCELTSEAMIKNDCFAQVAFFKKDASICESVAIGKGECYTTIAIENNDATYCSKGSLEKQQCYIAAASGNYSDCAEGLQRKICNDAITAGDATLCDNMQDFGDYCYLNVAINTNDSALCNMVQEKDHCFFKIATTVNNAALCDSIANESVRDNCVAWVALNTNNKELCYQAGSELQSCIEDVEYTYG